MTFIKVLILVFFLSTSAFAAPARFTIEIDGKKEVIETEQYFFVSEKGCSYSGAFEWLIGQVYFRLKEIEKKFANEKDK